MAVIMIDERGSGRLPDTPTGLLKGRFLAPTAGIVLTVTLLAFESMAVSTVMPVVVRDLDGLALYAWGFSAFLIPSLLANVVAGLWSDRSGPAPAMVAALCAFVVGLVIAGTAPVMWVFVAGRAAQGLGAGGAIVALYVVIAQTYPERMRPRVFAALAAAWVVPSLVGPALAGFVAQHLHWRWVFLGLIPLVIPAAGMLLPAVRGTRPSGVTPAPAPTATATAAATGAGAEPAGAESGGAATARRPEPAATVRASGPDPAPTAGGAAGGAAGGVTGRLLAAVAAAIGAATVLFVADHASWRLLPVGALGLAGLVAGLHRLLPAGALWLRRGLPTAVTARGLLSGTFFGAEAFIPLALTSLHGFSPASAGAVLTIGALGWSAASWYQSRSRWSQVALVRAGSVLVLAGVVAASAALQVSGWLVAPAWLVAGAGMGLALTNLSVLVLGWSPPGEQGANSAALQISDAVGAALGVGAAGALAVGFGAGRLGFGLAVAGFVTIMIGMVAVGAGSRLPHRSVAREDPVAAPTPG